MWDHRNDLMYTLYLWCHPVVAHVVVQGKVGHATDNQVRRPSGERNRHQGPSKVSFVSEGVNSNANNASICLYINTSIYMVRICKEQQVDRNMNRYNCCKFRSMEPRSVIFSHYRPISTTFSHYISVTFSHYISVTSSHYISATF